MTAPPRLVVVAVDGGLEHLNDDDLDQLTPESLATLSGVDGWHVIVVCWHEISERLAARLSGATVMCLEREPSTVTEKVLGRIAEWAHPRLASQAAGRLLISLSPMHRSRVAARRLNKCRQWRPQPTDHVVALELASTRIAWFAQRRGGCASATLGLTDALAAIRTQHER